MMSKPSIPKGTRDFGPKVMVRRNWIFATIRSVFERYGFEPIETPAMENLSTLTGKYGEEGDQLIFKILNNGDFLTKADTAALEAKDSKKLSFSISKKALRYDLTVPFARFVVMNQHAIPFPFKRYQIQPVWRGDRPGKGRYQEFFQCDADVVGSDALLHEVEFVRIFDEALSSLGIPEFNIVLNNRKVLAGIAEVAGASEKLTDLTVAIDKLDKIGREKVEEELVNRGISRDQIVKLEPLFGMEGTPLEVLQQLEQHLENSEIGKKGVEELRYVVNYVDDLGLNNATLVLDPTLARGLNYYTGAIFEVKVPESPVGSICGGGRYDDLTGIFGLKNMSGVGISFGADRIYDVLEHFDLFPSQAATSTQLLFVNFGEAEENYCMKLAQRLRGEGIRTEVYAENAKMKKQMKYADDKAIPFVALIGEDEMNSNTITVKNMESGNQEKVDFEGLLSYFG
ncbi:MAG: histidine--tRNA ligase [Flavobacteriales bacterium]|nr:histidine--tRNA ligase [Flavobacteriales bacterium]MDG1781180.1 histidine--tRNA ligase [Flavobacteriales bacterium]MDG2246951.1 histidine--tRNA ligase [Flavobacteriales bacterium]